MTILKEVFESGSRSPLVPTGTATDTSYRTRQVFAVTPAPRTTGGDSALFMSESIDGLDVGAHFLDRLSAEQKADVQAAGRTILVSQGDMVFSQGEHHSGIFIIKRGQVRVYYTAPSGREITLAYWTPGHFIGGPEISGGGPHMWSGIAMEDCEITALPSAALQRLLVQMPAFALALIDGLIAKGKCYSSMAQMLGTRSVIERLAQYLLNLAELYGVADGDIVIVNRKVTHDQIAAMVGSTRQWVTMMLKRFQTKHIIAIEDGVIRIKRVDLLEKILFRE
ncbi:Crp/Fnr family transcriptional regulator [Bradyrhizobium sp. UFLA 03-164]|uniref:Crp/Fnr family transcriptional regulator n=2 Tax=Bradyrhizobium uaiense TaxID=2594946 RepID=A0A6P1BWF8_9BRAD|nr:Crp/Fnr family transcriptional regulator [Bradyrhizobium uaiense]